MAADHPQSMWAPGPRLREVLRRLESDGHALLVSSLGTYLGEPGLLAVGQEGVEVFSRARALGFSVSPGNDRIALAAIGAVPHVRAKEVFERVGHRLHRACNLTAGDAPLYITAGSRERSAWGAQP